MEQTVFGIHTGIFRHQITKKECIAVKAFFGLQPHETLSEEMFFFDRGISESNQAAIFRRFYREEEVHEQQGVGIGLYLAREIVTRQGGYIKVVSEPGKGSEFSIMLPTK